MAALLLNGCAVQIYDAQFCAPVPGELGAVCDHFLTSDQQILTEAEWEALEAQWESTGNAVECTESGTLGNIKTEIEQLCSVTSCDYETEQTIARGLQRIEGLGNQARALKQVGEQR